MTKQRLGSDSEVTRKLRNGCETSSDDGHDYSGRQPGAAASTPRVSAACVCVCVWWWAGAAPLISTCPTTGVASSRPSRGRLPAAPAPAPPQHTHAPLSTLPAHARDYHRGPGPARPIRGWEQDREVGAGSARRRGLKNPSHIESVMRVIPGRIPSHSESPNRTLRPRPSRRDGAAGEGAAGAGSETARAPARAPSVIRVAISESPRGG